MKRKESALIAERNSAVVERIRQIKAEHPFWGYRRTWAHLKFIDGIEINKKRVLRLMQKHNLQMKPEKKLKATRTPARNKPQPHRPNQWWGINMTKVMVDGFGWMYIVVVLDWYTKKIAGYYTGMECKTSYNNPKGNADTEMVFRTMKEELLWLREWISPFELTDELSTWIEKYNRSYLHSALGYKPPIKFEEEYQNSLITPVLRA